MSRIKEYLDNFTPEELPEQYQTLVEIVGFKQALTLMEAFSGEYLYIPKTDALDQRLRNKRLYAAYIKGSKPSELASNYNLSVVQVYDIIHQMAKARRDKSK